MLGLKIKFLILNSWEIENRIYNPNFFNSKNRNPACRLIAM